MPENISLAGAINNESLSDQDQLALIKGELNRIVASFRDIMAEIDILQEDVAWKCAQDRQRIAALERVVPQPRQKARVEILRSLFVANGGKMLAKDARKQIRLSRILQPVSWAIKEKQLCMIDNY